MSLLDTDARAVDQPIAAENHSPETTSVSAADLTGRKLPLLAICAVLAAGIFLRLPADLFDTRGPLRSLGALHPNPGFTQVGFDESLYRGYVNSLSRVGLTEYPSIVEHYIEVQKTLTGSILPPMRFLYIFSAYLWHQVFGTEALLALHQSRRFSGSSDFCSALHLPGA